MLEEGYEAAADEVAGGVAARVDEENEEEVEVDVVEGLAVDVGRKERAGEVVAGAPALLLGDVVGVVEHLDHGTEGGALGLRLRGGVDGLGEVVEAAAVVEREPEQVGDDERRHLAGDVGHEVA